MNSLWKRVLLTAGLALISLPGTVLSQPPLPRPVVLYRPPVPAKQPRGPITIYPTGASVQSNGRPNGVAAPATMPNIAGTQSSASNPQVSNASMTGWNSGDAGFQQIQGTQQIGQTASQPGQAAAPSGQTNPAGTSDPTGQTGNQANPQNAMQQFLPANVILQNPSGVYNISHSGMTTSQQYAPNLYFGQQFQTWTNQQTMSDQSASYGEMSRFPPGQFGGYVAPNTYLGSDFFSWNNLSSGNISPGMNGGWSYSTWP